MKKVEWEKKQLAEIIDVKHGFAFPGENISEEPFGDILLSPGNFAIGGGFKRDKFKHFNGSVPDDYILSEGDLIVTMTDLSKQADTLGYPALVPKPGGSRFLHNQRLGKVLIKPNVHLDKNFLFYLLRTAEYRHEILASATGTTVKHTSPGRILAYKVALPPFSEQRAIASILGALDDKIELNRRMNATLEAMARALFQSWFVDFDPVRAKSEGRDPSAMDAETAALFPSEFVDSELGLIPKGWEVMTFADLLQLAYGKPLKECDRQGGSIAVFGSNGQVGWHNQKLISGPGIVVGRKGNPGVVTWSQGDFYAIDTTFYVIPTESCRSLYFLFHALSNHDLANLSADSAVPGLNRNHAYMSKQVIPHKLLLDAFDLQIAPIFEAIQANLHQSRTLAALRDTLLPRLLSGELSVVDISSHHVHA
jgi:type I restriction enzyme, S subunit